MADVTFQSVALGFSAAASGLQSLKQLIKGEDAKAQLAEVFGVLLSTQAHAFELHANNRSMAEEISALKEELQRVKAWDVQKQRYKLYSPWAGATVYAVKKSMNDGEPAHWICTHCYEDGRRAILQYRHSSVSGSAYHCPGCKATVHYPFWEGPQGDLAYAPE